MEQLNNMNLPIVGRIQHGEQQITNQKKKVVELGYFIAKIKNDNMQFLLNRFNEKYNHEKQLTIRFFDEKPLSIRHIRYNQSGAICYCMENCNQGKQRVSNIWKPVDCNENCTYRISADGTSKPMCNLEGTLKFLLPEISTDRIWIMKITGQTSIQRLKAYIALQRQQGNSIVGDYILFLKQEQQTNKMGKTFNNYVLDIVKKEDFISKNNIQSNEEQFFQNNTQTINISENKSSVGTIAKNSIKADASKNENVKKASKTQIDSSSNQENANSNNEFENYYILVETSTKTLMKSGKPTNYLVGNFVDMNDKIIEAIIPPKFADELLECDVGTTVILDLANAGNNIFINNIKYVQKCQKNVAA